MDTQKNNDPINTLMKVAVLALLIIWSFLIAKPFIVIIIWAIIMAVALYPFYKKVLALFKGKKKGLVTSLFTILLLAIIILPTISITKSIVGSTTEIVQNYKAGSLTIPPPDPSVEEWPLIGKKTYTLWSSAAKDIESFINKYPDEVEKSVGWFFDSFMGIMGSLLLSLVALIIAGIFMSSAESGYKTGVAFANKLMEGRGSELMDMCTSTIRSVVKGILLVGVIQAVLAYFGFISIGLSSTAGILAFVVMFAAIIQIPVSLVAIPVIIYVFSFADTTPAIIFGVYIFIVSLLDNVLKPMLLAKGLQTPMIVILIGAIGGMILSGLLGLFIGPVILAIVHRLYTSWVNDTELV